MGENEVVVTSIKPWASGDITAMAHKLGIECGDTVIVHCRMSSLGWVSGGAQAVVEGLLTSVGESGTLVMPAHTGGNSDPARWGNPPVPQEWWDEVRSTMPAFDPQRTPTRGVGVIPELFRTWPGVLRSNHPSCSFSAFGKHARFIISDNQSLIAFGEDSPLAKVYELDGKVLLIGVGHDRNTSMHLGEYRSGACEPIVQGAAILKDGHREWIWFDDIDMDSDRFPIIASEYEASGGEIGKGMICQADCMLFKQRGLVDFTASCLKARKELAGIALNAYKRN